MRRVASHLGRAIGSAGPACIDASAVARGPQAADAGGRACARPLAISASTASAL